LKYLTPFKTGRLAAERSETSSVGNIALGPSGVTQLSLKTDCAVETTLTVIGGVWKAPILFQLLGGTRRFGELSRLIINVAPKMLTLQLRQLEADGIVRRIIYPVVPPHVEYELTQFGRTLEPVLLRMLEWGATFQRLQAAGELRGRASAKQAVRLA
jgi:DNA-binding HxlR family transcriptional regulator